MDGALQGAKPLACSLAMRMCKLQSGQRVPTPRYKMYHPYLVYHGSMKQCKCVHVPTSTLQGTSERATI